MRTLLISAATSAALAFGLAWYIQGNRYTAQIAEIRADQSKSEANAYKRNLDQLSDFQQGLTDALQDFQYTNVLNREAQDKLQGTLRDLRTVTGGLRGDFAGLPGRIERATQSASAEYITTCTAVFADMAAEVGKLAESGAGIAAKADWHAADARLIYQSWPKSTPKQE